jgi:hypothetical protein
MARQQRYEYLDDRGLARLAEDLEYRHPSTFTGKRADWLALPAARREKYKIVNFIDDDSDFIGLRHPTIFTGTRAEWHALSNDEQSKYTLVCLIDDLAGIGWYLSNKVMLGDMNPVTSNAVAMEYGDVQMFNIDHSLWIPNTDVSTATDYPYIYQINTILYADESTPWWDMLGSMSTLMSESEREASNAILETVFTSTGITLYATDVPTVDLRLRVKGH